MKCKHCGHWNKPSFPRCFSCGEPLNPAEKKAPGWQEQFEKPQKKRKASIVFDDADPVVDNIVEAGQGEAKAADGSLAEEMSRLKNRRARGAVYLEAFRKSASEQGIAPTGSGVSIRRQDGFFEGVPDDPEETLSAPEAEKTEYRSQRSRIFRGDLTEDDFEPLPEDMEGALYADDLPLAFDDGPPLAPMPRQKRHKPRRRNPVSVAKWTVGLIAVAAVCFLAWQGVLYLQSASDLVRDTQEAIATIETIEIGGFPGRRIQIAGKEGSKIYIAELMRSYVVVDGVANIEVADYEFYKDIDHLESELFDATLTPTVWDDGTEQKLEPIHFTISIPLSPVRLLSPESAYTEVYTSIYNMEIQVEPKSRVVVNGEDISDFVSEEGIAYYNPPVQAIGNNTISITVRALYCRENNMTVTLYREPQEIPLELAPDTPTLTDTDELTINATTVAGAKITVESATYYIDDSDLAELGKFTVKARMTRVGQNTVVIRASVPGKEDAVLKHTATYLPPASKYTTKAWALKATDYTELLNNIQVRTEAAQIYLCSGKIIEIMSSNPQIAIMDTGKDGVEQLVMLQNETTKTWELGKSYDTYADVNGLYNVIPKFIARYCVDPEEKGVIY